MATRTATATPAAIQFEAILEDFTGKDGKEGRVLKFGPAGVKFPKFNFAPRTWIPLFATADADGDSNLFNVFSTVVGEAQTHEEVDAVVQGMLHAMEQFKAWYQERYDEEAPGLEDVEVAEEPTVVEPEPAKPTIAVVIEHERQARQEKALNTPIISVEEEAKFRKLLSTQSRVFQRATPDQQNHLVFDAWQVCAVEGLPFWEYRANLMEFGTAEEYIAAIS